MAGDRERQLLDGTCRYTNLMSARSRSDIIGCDEDQVVKLYSPQTPKETVEEEVYFTNLARGHGLRVPWITGLVNDNDRWGYSYWRLSGPTLLQWAVEEMGKTFDEVPLAFASIHRDIHGHNEPRLPSIRSRLRSTIDGESNVPTALKAKALRTLDSLPEDTCICHGDFHPENIIMAQEGPMILDWVDAASGHPLADVARSYLILDVWLPAKVSELGLDLSGPRMDSFCQEYRRAYFDLTDGPGDMFDGWLLTVAVARLCQANPGEEARLMEIINELI